MKVTPLFLLFLVFLVLKLTGYISWSWWWVTLPLTAPLMLLVPFLLLHGIGLLLAGKEGRARLRVAKALRDYSGAITGRER